jgi:hypothetical protein
MGYCIQTGRGLLLFLYTLAVECGSGSPLVLWGGLTHIALINYDYAGFHCPWSSGPFGLGVISRRRSGWVMNLMS